MNELADYAWLTSPKAAELLDDLAQDDSPLHSQLHQLRKLLSAERARLAVEQATLRKRAVDKFGRHACRMFFTELALQQATDLWTGRYKAGRFPRDEPVTDCCTGIGGDLLALAERGPASGWDRAPEMALLAEANLRGLGGSGYQVQVGDVAGVSPTADEYWHLDPDRRVDGRRSTQVRWHSPGPKVIERWLATAPQGVVKLAPATEVPESWQREAELEWVSRDGQCRQLLAWFGKLASSADKRRATALQAPQDEDAQPIAYGFAGTSGLTTPLASQVDDYIYDTDPAIRAADLTGALAEKLELSAFSSQASYLTANRHIDHPLLSSFSVVDQLPLREKPLASHLRSLGIGRLEIKKRGVECDPEQLRGRLKLRGDASATLLLTRQGKREIAILAHRCQIEESYTG